MGCGTLLHILHPHVDLTTGAFRLGRRRKEGEATEAEIAEAIMVGVALSAGAAMAHGAIAMQALE